MFFLAFVESLYRDSEIFYKVLLISETFDPTKLTKHRPLLSFPNNDFNAFLYQLSWLLKHNPFTLNLTFHRFDSLEIITNRPLNFLVQSNRELSHLQAIYC